MNSYFKVTCTHKGETTDYYNRLFTSINVKLRENNYNVATLTLPDAHNYHYSFSFAPFDTIHISFKNGNETNYVERFAGTIRQVNPSFNSEGKTLILNCKGYGVELEETHCNRDYGLESSNSTLNTIDEIITDIVDNFTEKSFTGDVTNHTLATTRVSDYVTTDIKYVNNPYRTNLEVLDTLAQLSSAIGAGTTAGGHWIVVPDTTLTAMLLWAKIGDHAAGTNSPEAYWPDWWNYLEADSALTEGLDFTDYSILNKAEEYANKIVLITDFRRPAFDYWTEDSGGAALWGNDSLTGVTDSNTQYKVGSHSLKIDPDGANTGYAYFPASADAAWDVTKWGSAKTIPHINFYIYKNATFTEATSYIYMSTNTAARKTDYFYCAFSTWTENDNEWIHKSIPIGPYWASSEESKQYRWSSQGNPDWAKIDTIEFMLSGTGADGLLYVDDLHFNGKVTRSAADTSEITLNKEYQKVIIARNSMDDTCVAGVGAGKDDGYAGRIAYAELLRRASVPSTFNFTLKQGRPLMLAGQKTHLHIGKRRDNTYKHDCTARFLTIEHNWNETTGLTTTCTATTDLLNSFPISAPDQYAMMMENLFLNSSEAKNIRAGAEVDLLIPILESDY